MEIYRIAELSDAPLAAAAQFYSDHLPEVSARLKNADAIAIVLPQAAYDHRDWRLACVRDLARQFAPKRVNMLGAGSDHSVQQTVKFLARSAAMTGQYLSLTHDD